MLPSFAGLGRRRVLRACSRRLRLLPPASALLAAILLTPAAGRGAELCVQLKWLHQAQFAGFYLAREEGFYRD